MCDHDRAALRIATRCSSEDPGRMAADSSSVHARHLAPGLTQIGEASLAEPARSARQATATTRSVVVVMTGRDEDELVETIHWPKKPPLRLSILTWTDDNIRRWLGPDERKCIVDAVIAGRCQCCAMGDEELERLECGHLRCVFCKDRQHPCL